MSHRLTGSRFSAVPLWLLESGVSDRGLRLYAVLQTYLTGREGRAWPSRKTMGERLGGCSRDTIDRAIKDLEAVGAIHVERQFTVDVAGKKQWLTNDYYIVSDDPEVAARLRPPSRTVAAAPSRIDARTPSRKNAALIKTQFEEDPKEEDTSAVADRDETKQGPLWIQARRLCAILAELVAENGSKAPRVTDTWEQEAERLLRLDGRDFAKAERLIRWCQADPFWRGNVLSMPTFRAKYDQMRLQANRQVGHGEPKGAAALQDFGRSIGYEPNQRTKAAG